MASNKQCGEGQSTEIVDGNNPRLMVDFYVAQRYSSYVYSGYRRSENDN